MADLVTYRCIWPEHRNPELLVTASHAYESVVTLSRGQENRTLRLGPYCAEHAEDAAAEMALIEDDGVEVRIEVETL